MAHYLSQSLAYLCCPVPIIYRYLRDISCWEGTTRLLGHRCWPKHAPVPCCQLLPMPASSIASQVVVFLIWASQQTPAGQPTKQCPGLPVPSGAPFTSDMASSSYVSVNQNPSSTTFHGDCCISSLQLNPPPVHQQPWPKVVPYVADLSLDLVLWLVHIQTSG